LTSRTSYSLLCDARPARAFRCHSKFDGAPLHPSPRTCRRPPGVRMGQKGFDALKNTARIFSRKPKHADVPCWSVRPVMFVSGGVLFMNETSVPENFLKITGAFRVQQVSWIARATSKDRMANAVYTTSNALSSCVSSPSHDRLLTSGDPHRVRLNIITIDYHIE
jgi:hypothetical protein